ncbi:hypothetical protein [Virgibacillus halodenitrificans]|uniref:hypothetical protein n=1 Tax=Virgibacillus halodenitrificans TaxID=1482 RepID=UPI000EF4CEA8|nr:hypothetical protein [Virgibacillus halodenitrificans]
MKRLLELISFILIVVAAIWFSWDYIIEYIPIINDWIENTFDNLMRMIISVIPLVLGFFIFLTIINNH